MSVTTGASSKTPKAPKPAKSLHWLSEVTKPTSPQDVCTAVFPTGIYLLTLFPKPTFFFSTCATCLILKCSFQRLKKTSSVCLSTNVKLYGHCNRERSGFIIIISEIFLSSEKTALSGEDTQRKRK